MIKRIVKQTINILWAIMLILIGAVIAWGLL